MKPLLKFAATMLSGAATAALIFWGLFSIVGQKHPSIVVGLTVAFGVSGLLIALGTAWFLRSWNESLSDTAPTLQAAVYSAGIVWVATLIMVEIFTGETLPFSYGLIGMVLIHGYAVGLGTSICGKLFYETSDY